MNLIANLALQRSAWILLSLSALILESTALYFQYQMGLAPCIMCIYQRTAVLGLLFAGVVGAIAPQNIFIRMSGFAIWAVSAIWGYLIAAEHIAMQNNTDPFAFSCEIVPNFPSFMPLHQWLPWFFEATGDCGNIDWSFLTMSMPAWMQITFAIYTILFIAVFAISLMKPNVQLKS